MGGKGRPGPRQPLSQRRPAAALRKGPGARPLAPVPEAAVRRPKPAASRSGKPGSERTGGARHAPAGRRRDHAAEVYRRLVAVYPDAHCELDYGDAWQLLVATIMSAQCTDKRVNMVTPSLFRAWPNPEALSAARQEDVEEIIRSTGFFRNKARNLIAMSGALHDRHGGQVPASMEALVALPGVGRKTANVVLGNACGVNEGVVVDTHVQRLSKRLGLSREKDPVKVERDLMQLFERDRWTQVSHLLIWHGRRLCHARKPLCEQCPLADICPSAGTG